MTDFVLIQDYAQVYGEVTFTMEDDFWVCDHWPSTLTNPNDLRLDWHVYRLTHDNKVVFHSAHKTERAAIDTAEKVGWDLEKGSKANVYQRVVPDHRKRRSRAIDNCVYVLVETA